MQSQRHKAPVSLEITPIDLHAPVTVQYLSTKLKSTPTKNDAHVQICDSSHLYI